MAFSRTPPRLGGLSIALWLLASAQAIALDPGPNDVYVRVVDVGAGLCTVTEIPGGHYMVYDAGHWQSTQCFAAVQEIVDGDVIDLLIISHTDADHLGEADEILGQYDVQQIIRNGSTRDSGAWENANAAIAGEADASIMNLQTVDLVPGTVIELGDATVTLVAGWGQWTDPGPTSAEKLNATSIVVRLAYRGNSVLFTGDTIGRRLHEHDSSCRDAEAFMLENSARVPIRSDVMIAPHHGGDNGSSRCFIVAVDPEFVIFSAGHKHHHPSDGAVNRYLAHGVAHANLFRTDRSDDEGGDEWTGWRIPECNDGRGDDDVDIVLPFNGPAQVDYRQAAAGC